jgi:hypothetical protein
MTSKQKMVTKKIQHDHNMNILRFNMISLIMTQNYHHNTLIFLVMTQNSTYHINVNMQLYIFIFFQ